MTQLGKKIMRKVDQINQAGVTKVEIGQDFFLYTPKPFHIPEVTSGNIYIGKFRLLSYKRMRRNLHGHVYGITTGPYYTAIHFNRMVLHINIPKIHKSNLHLKYYFKGMATKVGYTAKEMKKVLETM